MSEPIVVAALVTSSFVLLERLVGWIRNRRKDDAEAELTVAETNLTVGKAWQEIADDLRQDITDLRGRVEKLEDENGDLRKENGDLRSRLAAALAEVDRYKAYTRSFALHVLRLRDALGKGGVEAPMLPSDVEDALTFINLP